MRWIYLSPHLDDAVFSAGGLIADQTRAGIAVEIWTLMAGYAAESDVSPVAELLHSIWGASSAEEATHMRRAEDRRAAAKLGAGVVHFDFLDCIYRRGANGEWLYSEVFGFPHPDEAALPAQIAETLRPRLQPGDVLVCQVALGSHVDHVLVRQGAEQLGLGLLYTIDVPYIFYKPQELVSKSAGLRESIHKVTEPSLSLWKEACLAYTSQIVTLGETFDTPEKVRESIHAYWAKDRGIRLLQ